MKKNSLLDYSLAITLILDGWSVYVSPDNMRVFFTIIGVFLMVVIFYMFRPKERHKCRSLLLFLSFVSFTYFIIRPSHLLAGVALYVLFLPLFIDYLLKCKLNKKPFEILYKIDNIICFLSFFSILLWIIGPVFNLIGTNVTYIGDWGSWDEHDKISGYFGLLFKAQTEDGTFLENRIWRNTCIFTEGPMYNLWLDISLCTELFLKSKVNRLRVFILIVSILTTFSTTGYIFVLIIVFVNLIYKECRLNMNIKILWVIFSFVFIGLTYYLIDGLLIMKSDSNSFLIRMTSYDIAFSAFLSNPLMGIGYLMGADVAESFGFTNSFTDLLGQGGLWLFLIVYGPLLYYLMVMKHKSKDYISLFLLFMYLAITTNFYSRLLFFVIPAFFYSRIFYYYYYEKGRNLNCNLQQIKSA